MPFQQHDGQEAAACIFDDPGQIKKALIASAPAVEPEDGLGRLMEGCRVRELGSLMKDRV